jgi:hypothetical protein
MRGLFTVLFTILVSGCTSSESHPVAPSERLNLAIVVKVSGALSAGSATYPVTLDDTTSFNFVANEEGYLAVSTGNHTVALGSPLIGFSPTTSWCLSVGPNSFVGLISADSITRVTFSLNCPSVVGTGTLQLSLAGAGERVPEGIPVSLTRLNGPPSSNLFDALARSTTSLNVPAKEPIKVSLPAGLYRVRPAFPANCLPVDVQGNGTVSRAVRNGDLANVTIAYSCS